MPTTGSGSLSSGKFGVGGLNAAGFGSLKGDGTAGVDCPKGEPGLAGLGVGENGEGGGDMSPNDGGLKLGSENFGGSGASGGMSITGSSITSLAFISLRISSSDAYIVFSGSDSAGSSRTSPSFDGSGTGASELADGMEAAISSGRATIVLYGSSGTSATKGVPSDWQNRIESSNVLSQVGHFFIRFPYLRLQIVAEFRKVTVVCEHEKALLQLTVTLHLTATIPRLLYLDA